MTHYYQHIYTALRSAMVDRDMGDKLEDAVLIDFKSAHVALKKEVPSAALMVAYSMLYYPTWLTNSAPAVGKPPVSQQIENFIGGIENPRYPLLFNIHMAMIAVAIGCHAKLWTIKYSHVLGTVLLAPNMENPLVLKTRELIIENSLTYTSARDIFIELMQQDEYVGDIALADDFVANASFIDDDVINVGEDNSDRINNAIQLDLSKDFGGISEGDKE